MFLGFEISEADNSMDVSNTPSTTITPSVRKITESTGSAFNYSNDSAFLSQPHYPQPMNMYGINETRGAQLLLGTNAPSSGAMLLARGGHASGLSRNGLPSHFAHPHQIMRPQSSVGGISDYRS